MLKLKLQSFGHLMQSQLNVKDLMLRKIEAKREGAGEDEMVRAHHRLSGYESEQTPGDSEGQGGLVCCSLRATKSRTGLGSSSRTICASDIH